MLERKEEGNTDNAKRYRFIHWGMKNLLEAILLIVLQRWDDNQEGGNSKHGNRMPAPKLMLQGETSPGKKGIPEM